MSTSYSLSTFNLSRITSTFFVSSKTLVRLNEVFCNQMQHQNPDKTARTTQASLADNEGQNKNKTSRSASTAFLRGVRIRTSQSHIRRCCSLKSRQQIIQFVQFLSYSFEHVRLAFIFHEIHNFVCDSFNGGLNIRAVFSKVATPVIKH